MLDDGRLTDGQGRTVDFRNTIIVLTSNLGSDVLAHQPDGESTDMVQAQVMKVVRDHFRPEFLNRLDEIILFSRLQKADMTKIVDIQIRRLQKLLEDRKIVLSLDDLAHAWLANEGYDPVYGARPLKRVIQRSLQNPLAELLLQGPFMMVRMLKSPPTVMASSLMVRTPPRLLPDHPTNRHNGRGKLRPSRFLLRA